MVFLNIAAVCALLLLSAEASAAITHPWLDKPRAGATLGVRIAPPLGYVRVDAPAHTFAAWLRGLPLKRAGTPVRLFDGRVKPFQSGAFAVIDIDVGQRDLQQCADAVMRLRAEYLLQNNCDDEVAFNFTSGHRARWSDWRAGQRPLVNGNQVTWKTTSAPDASYRAFRGYLNSVFLYAGSHSLAREMQRVDDPKTVQPGDVFIQGGFPGHAVLVADVAQNARGERVFLLMQSYMPAQDIHVLINPKGEQSAWYPARDDGLLVTPEWTFSYNDLRRFAAPNCVARGVARGFARR